MTDTAADTGKVKDSEAKGEQWKFYTHVLAAVTALLVLVGTVLGFVSKNQAEAKHTAQNQATDLSGTVEELQATVDILKRENGDLKQRNADLTQQLARATGEKVGGGGPGPAQSDWSPPVWHKGNVTLAEGSLNLDAPADDKRWGQGTNIQGDPHDLRFTTGRLGWAASSMELAVASMNIACDEAPGLKRRGLGEVGWPISKGLVLCAKTSQGRYAKIEVLSDPREDNTVDLHILTARKSTDG